MVGTALCAHWARGASGSTQCATPCDSITQLQTVPYNVRLKRYYMQPAISVYSTVATSNTATSKFGRGKGQAQGHNLELPIDTTSVRAPHAACG
jgi:hypothetical protein